MFGNRWTHSAKWKRTRFVERTDELHNPYRGMYAIFCFDAEDGLSKVGKLPVECSELKEGQTLALLEIRLRSFNQGPLTEAALANIEKILSYFTVRGLGIILRFVYDWDGFGIQTEPENVEIILGHMDQLSPLMMRYEKYIFIAQGLFTGSWGEMHNTRFRSDYYLRLLAEKHASVTGANTFLAVRCPNIWRTLFRTSSPLDDVQTNYRDNRGRFGLFNDAILASETDMGTYGETIKGAASRWDDKFIRWDELAFQEKLCCFVPNGGETVNESKLNDFANAVQTLRQMHVTYLNSGYDTKVLDKWKNTVVKMTKSVWNGMSGYDYIAAHLGYRFMIRKVKLLPGNSADQCTLAVTVENAGFAPCYRKLEARVLLRSRATGQTREIPVEVDTRTWFPGKESTFETVIDLKDMQKSGYRVGIALTCPLTNAPVQFANTQDWEFSEFPNPIGEIQL